MKTIGEIFGKSLNLKLNKDVASGVVSGISLNKPTRIMTIKANFDALIPQIEIEKFEQSVKKSSLELSAVTL